MGFPHGSMEGVKDAGGHFVQLASLLSTKLHASTAQVTATPSFSSFQIRKPQAAAADTTAATTQMATHRGAMTLRHAFVDALTTLPR